MTRITDFSDLLVAKICHDLSNPVSAVSNGVEFLEEAQDKSITDKALELVSLNASELVNKLKLFRFMYGRANSEGEMDFNELKTILTDFYSHSKINIHWPVCFSKDDIINLTTLASRLFANLVYLISTTLIAGGEIKIDLDHKGAIKHIKIAAKGPRIKIHGYIEPIFAGKEPEEIKLESIQVHLAAKLAEQLGVVVKVLKDEDTVAFEVRIN